MGDLLGPVEQVDNFEDQSNSRVQLLHWSTDCATVHADFIVCDSQPSSPVIPLITSTVSRVMHNGRNDRAVELGLNVLRRCSFEANQSYPKLSSKLDDSAVDVRSLCKFTGYDECDTVSFSPNCSMNHRLMTNSPPSSMHLPSLDNSFLSYFNSSTQSTSLSVYSNMICNPNKAVVTVDCRTLVILTANDVACELFAFQNVDDLIGRCLQDFISLNAVQQKSMVESFLEPNGNIVQLSGKVWPEVLCACVSKLVDGWVTSELIFSTLWDKLVIKVDVVDSAQLTIPCSVWVKKLSTVQPRCLVVLEPVEQMSGIIQFSAQGVITDCDLSLVELYGYTSPSDIIGLSVSNLVLSIPLPLPTNFSTESFTGQTQDGTTFPLSLSLLKRGDGEKDAYTVKITVCSTISGLITVYSDGHIHNINNSLAHILLGFSSQQLISKSIKEILPEITKDMKVRNSSPCFDENQLIDDGDCFQLSQDRGVLDAGECSQPNVEFREALVHQPATCCLQRSLQGLCDQQSLDNLPVALERDCRHGAVVSPSCFSDSEQPVVDCVSDVESEDTVVLDEHPQQNSDTSWPCNGTTSQPLPLTSEAVVAVSCNESLPNTSAINSTDIADQSDSFDLETAVHDLEQAVDNGLLDFLAEDSSDCSDLEIDEKIRQLLSMDDQLDLLIVNSDLLENDCCDSESDVDGNDLGNVTSEEQCRTKTVCDNLNRDGVDVDALISTTEKQRESETVTSANIVAGHDGVCFVPGELKEIDELSDKLMNSCRTFDDFEFPRVRDQAHVVRLAEGKPCSTGGGDLVQIETSCCIDKGFGSSHVSAVETMSRVSSEEQTTALVCAAVETGILANTACTSCTASVGNTNVLVEPVECVSPFHDEIMSTGTVADDEQVDTYKNEVNDETSCGKSRDGVLLSTEALTSDCNDVCSSVKVAPCCSCLLAISDNCSSQECYDRDESRAINCTGKKVDVERIHFKEGTYFGLCRHRDGHTFSVIYQVCCTHLADGTRMYCIWLTRSTELSIVDVSHHSVAENTSASHTDALANVAQPSSSEPAVDLEHNNKVGLSSKSAATAAMSSMLSNGSREYGEQYETLQSIGKGGFGFVALARRRHDNFEVVVKFIRKTKLSPESLVNHGEFSKVPFEISLLLGLQHANIIKVLDHFEGEHFYEMVMEKHGPGIDLFEFIESSTSVPEPVCSFIFRQLVSALTYLHSNNIVHRDIKDENVIIDESFYVKLIDFGSAAYFDDDTRKFATFCGTMEYCSPEVLLGNRYRGPELEMWSLGVTLYTLVFGENPFAEIQQAIEAIICPPFERSSDLMNLLLWLLDPEPCNRATILDLETDAWTWQDVEIGMFKFNEIFHKQAVNNCSRDDEDIFSNDAASSPRSVCSDRKCSSPSSSSSPCLPHHVSDESQFVSPKKNSLPLTFNDQQNIYLSDAILTSY